MKYNEQVLIEAILAEGKEGQLATSTFFNAHKNMIHLLSSKYRLTVEDRQSAYADAIMAVIHALKNGTYKKEAKLETYLSTIFKHKCVNLSKQNLTIKREPHRADWIDDLLDLTDEAKSAIHKIISKERYEQFVIELEKIGEKCKRLLLAIGQGYSTQEIMKEMGYTSKGSIKVSRHRCIQRFLGNSE